MYYSNTVIKPTFKPLSEIEKIERKRLLGNYQVPDPNTPYTIRAGNYARVSSGPQGEEDKASLPEQERRANEVIESNKWIFIRGYQDIKETTYEESPYEREGLKQALIDAENGLFDVLIVWIDSRLGRNADETREIRKRFRDFGVQIYSIKKPLSIIDPRFFTPKVDKFRKIQEGINDLMSESEMAEFSAKMEFGKMNVAMRGKNPGKVPFGYRKKKKVIVVNGKDKIISETLSTEEQQGVVKLIFDYYLKKGLGIRKICDELNHKNLTAPKGGRWNYSTVRYMLKNPVYAGKVRWGWKLSQFRKSKQRLMKGHTGVITEGEHDKVIKEDEFIQIQKKIEERAKLGGRAVASRGLLVGILKCPICNAGAHITSSPSWYAYKMEKQGKPKDKYSKDHYYVCSTVSKYGNTACKRYIGAQKKIEDLVVNQIREIANSPQTQKSFEQTLKKTDSEFSFQRKITIQKELEMLPIKRDRFTKAYGVGVMEFNEYAKNMKETTDIENNLHTELTELQEKEKNNEVFREKVLHTIQVFRDFDKIWDGASFELKKDLLSSILNRVVYSKNKIKIDYKV
jgi:site-specific DNA recombinase